MEKAQIRKISEDKINKNKGTELQAKRGWTEADVKSKTRTLRRPPPQSRSPIKMHTLNIGNR